MHHIQKGCSQVHEFGFHWPAWWVESSETFRESAWKSFRLQFKFYFLLVIRIQGRVYMKFKRKICCDYLVSGNNLLSAVSRVWPRIYYKFFVLYSQWCNLLVPHLQYHYVNIHHYVIGHNCIKMKNSNIAIATSKFCLECIGLFLILMMNWVDLSILTHCNTVGGTSDPDRPSGSGSSDDSGCSSQKRARKEDFVGGFLDLNLPAEVIDRSWSSTLDIFIKT